MSLFGWWDRWILERHRISDSLWSQVTERLHLLVGLNQQEHDRLRDLASLFVHRKAVAGVNGLVVDDSMRIEIASQACLPILELGLDYYNGWTEIIVYPGDFVSRHRYADEAGVVHEIAEGRIGEAWERGPVVLSWEGVEASRGGDEEGFNVIVHELAHKLDGLDGAVNGRPPLHAGMSGEAWAAALSAAYERLANAVIHRH